MCLFRFVWTMNYLDMIVCGVLIIVWFLCFDSSGSLPVNIRINFNSMCDCELGFVYSATFVFLVFFLILLMVW